MSDVRGIPRARQHGWTGLVRAVLPRRRESAEDSQRWAHAAQLSATLVRDPQAPGAGANVAQIRNGGDSPVHAVTMVVRERETGLCHEASEAHTLHPGHDLRLPVPAWAGTDDRYLVIRFTDTELVTWQLDVTTGTVREESAAGAGR